MDEKTLLSLGYRKYKGAKIDIYFNKEMCEHAGNCVHGAPEVFMPERKPWIIPPEEKMEHTIKVIQSCPSGALKYKLAGADEILP